MWLLNPFRFLLGMFGRFLINLCRQILGYERRAQQEQERQDDRRRTQAAEARAHASEQKALERERAAREAESRAAEAERSAREQVHRPLPQETPPLPDRPPPKPAAPPRPQPRSSSADAIFAELDELVGLTNVKADLRSLYDAMYSIRAVEAAGGTTSEPPSLHMAFLGNPGTGKTTVARLLARMFNQLGFLKTANMIETDRAGLVGAYQGHTEKAVREKIEEARNGVLFIDEAYGLADPDSPGDSFGKTALNLLIKAMEDERHQLVVIVAGYHRKMQRFLDANEGMRSRLAKTVEFHDYTPHELVATFKYFAKRDGFIVDPSAEPKVLRLVQHLYDRRTEAFGNARDVRNMLQHQVRPLHGRRLQRDPSADRRLLTAADIPD